MGSNPDQSLASQLNEAERIRQENGLIGLSIQRKDNQRILDDGDVIPYVLEVTKMMIDLMNRRKEIPLARSAA